MAGKKIAEGIELDKLAEIGDIQTREYLRQIVPIHAKRMILEGVEYWWTDEVLLVVFAGLMKWNLIKLPEKNFMQALEIARICDKICREKRIKCDIFTLSLGGMRIHEYEETMQRANQRLVI